MLTPVRTLSSPPAIDGEEHMRHEQKHDSAANPTMGALRRLAVVLLAGVALTAGTAAAAQATSTVRPKAMAAPVTFQLIARHSGGCLMPAVGVTTDGAAVLHVGCDGSPAQRWYLNLIGPGLFEVRNAASDRCLDLYGWGHDDAVTTIMWGCHGGTNQRWFVTRNSAGYHEIRSQESSKCVDIPFARSTVGLPAWQWGCHGGDNQQFLLA
jgi:hypothetical protein